MTRWRLIVGVILGFTLSTAEVHAQSTDVPAGVMPGTTLPTGVGNLADATILHGFTTSFQAGAGASSKTSSFGYENLTISGRYTPGTSSFGRRFSFLVGLASWYTPAPSSIYPSAFVTANDSAAPSTVNTVMAGFSLVVFGDRQSSGIDPGDPKYDKDPSWMRIRPQLEELDLREQRCPPYDAICKKAVARARLDALWVPVIRPTLRSPSLVLGILGRLGALATVSDVEAVDAFAAYAMGKDWFDAAFAFHYMVDARDSLILKHAWSVSTGMFADLSEDAAPPVLGLSLGGGGYQYAARTITTADGPLSVAPLDKRLDATLSFSGVPDTLGGQTAGVGFRLTHVVHDGTSNETQFQLLLSSNFRIGG